MFRAWTCVRSIDNIYGSCFGSNILIFLSWVDCYGGGSSIIDGVVGVTENTDVNFFTVSLLKLNVAYGNGIISLLKALITCSLLRRSSLKLWFVSDFSSFLSSFLGFVKLLKLLIASTRITWPLIESSSVILPFRRSILLDRIVLNYWKSNILSILVSSVLYSLNLFFSMLLNCFCLFFQCLSEWRISEFSLYYHMLLQGQYFFTCCLVNVIL